MDKPLTSWKTVEEWRQRLSEAKLRLDLARSYVREAIYELPLDQISSAAGHLAYCQAIKLEMLALHEYIQAQRRCGQPHPDSVIADNTGSLNEQVEMLAR